MKYYKQRISRVRLTVTYSGLSVLPWDGCCGGSNWPLIPSVGGTAAARPWRARILCMWRGWSCLKEKGAVILAVGICGLSACRWLFIGSGLAAPSKPLLASWKIRRLRSPGGCRCLYPRRSPGWGQTGSTFPILSPPHRLKLDWPLKGLPLLVYTKLFLNLLFVDTEVRTSSVCRSVKTRKMLDFDAHPVHVMVLSYDFDR